MNGNVEPVLRSALWIGVTVACYLVGLRVRALARRHAVANPVLIAITLMVTVLLLTRTPYPVYFRATWPITFLLGPATVALGLPLARNLRHIRAGLGGVALGLLAGSVTSMASGVLLVRLFHGSRDVAMSMLPKSVTTPIAMSVAAQVGGLPALAAALAIVGGIVAAVSLRGVLGALRVDHDHAVGLAAGTAGSGIAAAHVAAMGDGAAAFAAIGIGLNGLVTALLAPLVAALWR